MKIRIIIIIIIITIIIIIILAILQKADPWRVYIVRSPVESSVLVSNSMDSSPLSILEPLKLDQKQLHVNIVSYKYLAVFIVKH